MLDFVGTHFAINEPWGKQEYYIIDTVKRQVELNFPDDRNLIINITWLGPQFNNGIWDQVLNIKDEYDNLFWLAPVDPLTVTKKQRNQVEQQIGVKRVFHVGSSFDPGLYTFNTGAIASYQDFPKYTDDDVRLETVEHKYMCLNRKPKPHRIRIVESLKHANLINDGIVTLGLNNAGYDASEGINTDVFLKIENDAAEDYAPESVSGRDAFGGVPFDVCSLGRLDIWRKHFLNVVSETEWRPWDPMFVTEKTWKPIIGLRPFIINGQPQIYQWLRDNGFKTFTHYFPVELEDVNEEQIIPAITEAVKYLTTADLNSMYVNMLPDLVYNRKRFFEFAQEQDKKLNELFNGK
jgi:hypothetical protein